MLFSMNDVKLFNKEKTGYYKNLDSNIFIVFTSFTLVVFL